MSEIIFCNKEKFKTFTFILYNFNNILMIIWKIFAVINAIIFDKIIFDKTITNIFCLLKPSIFSIFIDSNSSVIIFFKIIMYIKLKIIPIINNPLFSIFNTFSYLITVFIVSIFWYAWTKVISLIFAFDFISSKI